MMQIFRKFSGFLWGIIPLVIIGYLFWNAEYNTPEDRAYRAFDHMAQRLQDKLQPQAKPLTFTEKLDIAWHRFLYQFAHRGPETTDTKGK